jgi:hypothetical protein
MIARLSAFQSIRPFFPVEVGLMAPPFSARVGRACRRAIR